MLESRIPELGTRSLRPVAEVGILCACSAGTNGIVDAIGKPVRFALIVTLLAGCEQNLLAGLGDPAIVKSSTPSSHTNTNVPTTTKATNCGRPAQDELALLKAALGC